MHKWMITIALLVQTMPAVAEPSNELIYRLKASVVKVHVADKNDNHGLGSGVVVGKNLVATNCHVLANARGVSIRKMGESHAPVALKTDWRHDLCLLRFEGLDMQPIELGDSGGLQYEQPVFSIGFPQGSPKPQVNYGKVKALYPLDGGHIIRTSASFRMGASGSPVMDEQGRLIGISTFKSPGRRSYYYNLPVAWVKKLLIAEETRSTKQEELPFWDAPENEQPFFMRVVLPYMGHRWDDLSLVAQAWSNTEPNNAEAWFYRGYAEEKLGNISKAVDYYRKTLTLNPEHASALFEMGMLASRQGDRAEYQRISMQLDKLDRDTADELRNAVATSNACAATC